MNIILRTYRNCSVDAISKASMYCTTGVSMLTRPRSQLSPGFSDLTLIEASLVPNKTSRKEIDLYWEIAGVKAAVTDESIIKVLNKFKI